MESHLGGPDVASNREVTSEEHESTHTKPLSYTGGAGHPMRVQALRYIAMARPHHYGKNVLVVLGALLAGLQRPGVASADTYRMLGLGLTATCLIASSNYVLNEILDAQNDRFHKSKSGRPMAAGHVSRRFAFIEWFLLAAIGLFLASRISMTFFATASCFQIMAMAYNVPPVRMKDVPYLDVLSEAINSPIRLLLGWLIIQPTQLPGIFLLLAFWMAGAFEMARKRLKEFRFLDDPQLSFKYRKSFAHYNESRLKSSMAVYAAAVLVVVLMEPLRFVFWFNNK
ncbi:MAG: UbiA family prenyltransferase [Planctomycetales bacterium]|nr:UbiA family prenyltransferase [Planctomycetales bacterium]